MATKITQVLSDEEQKLLSSVTTKIGKLIDRNGFVKKNSTTVVIDRASYGTKLPTTGVEGQIFFLVDEVK